MTKKSMKKAGKVEVAKINKTKKIVPDTSVIIDGRLTELVESGKLKNCEIIIPEFVISELENQANRGRETGDAGLEELKQLRELAEKRKDISISHKGRKPTLEEINLARSGRIDALIRDIAEEEKAVLYTSDKIHHKVALAKGIKTEYFEKEQAISRFSLEKFFDKETMSVHLKYNVSPMAKKGKPGEVKLVNIRKEVMSENEMESLIKEIIEKAKSSEKGLIEMSKRGVMVIQIEDYRIVIANPPFSDASEITAVRPITYLKLDDYNLSAKLKQRLRERAEGILIAGSPGHGKSTFAQALAEFYRMQGKIVKSMEHPRDLKVNEEITQYGALEDDFANTADVLLLVRPDYTIFDEVRKTREFEVFADLRLSGVGMVGVVHASDALDAIQRLIGRVELGIIPHVVDTVIFIRNAGVNKVYSVRLTVKVPTGMMQEDLARPVIEVVDFETNKAEYEIYTFGEENVVIPVEEAKGKTGKKAKDFYAEEHLRMVLERYVENPEVEFISEDRVTVRVDERDIARLIGKEGKRIDGIEKKLGVKINVEPRSKTLKGSVSFDLNEGGNYVAIGLGKKFIGKTVEIYDSGNFMFSATVGKKGDVKITKDFELAGKILGSFSRGSLRVYI